MPASAKTFFPRPSCSTAGLPEVGFRNWHGQLEILQNRTAVGVTEPNFWRTSCSFPWKRGHIHIHTLPMYPYQGKVEVGLLARLLFKYYVLAYIRKFQNITHVCMGLPHGEPRHSHDMRGDYGTVLLSVPVLLYCRAYYGKLCSSKRSST